MASKFVLMCRGLRSIMDGKVWSRKRAQEWVRLCDPKNEEFWMSGFDAGTLEVVQSLDEAADAEFGVQPWSVSDATCKISNDVLWPSFQWRPQTPEQALRELEVERRAQEERRARLQAAHGLCLLAQ